MAASPCRLGPCCRRTARRRARSAIASIALGADVELVQMAWGEVALRCAGAATPDTRRVHAQQIASPREATTLAHPASAAPIPRTPQRRPPRAFEYAVPRAAPPPGPGLVVVGCGPYSAASAVDDDDATSMAMNVSYSVHCSGQCLTAIPQGLPATAVFLHLGNNNITALQPRAFAGFSRLQSLSLMNNAITALQPGIFAGLTSLQNLYMSSIAITALPAGIFAGLTSLQRLDLYNNRLTALPGGIFAGLPSLQQLCVSMKHCSPCSDRCSRRLRADS
eukprot:m.163108 g.163108  ORF g.163108 m.163108 type:complete len:278 (-) comp9873_c0_seq22:530-1363(-)